MAGSIAMSQTASRLEKFEHDLVTFDRSAYTVYNSFEEADATVRKYWRSRTPIERMIALEHIRQLAWGYDDANPPRLPRSPELLQLSVRPLSADRRIRSELPRASSKHKRSRSLDRDESGQRRGSIESTT